MLFFILLFGLGSAVAYPVCDVVGPDCNVVTSLSFANLDTVEYTYSSPGNTVVGGVTYDVVIRWQPETGAQITHSWTARARNRRVNFDCTNSRMWFDGIIVDANPGWTGNRLDIPICTFNMQSGVLTSAYMANPGPTVFFLFSQITGNNKILYIDKNDDLPIIPSDSYDPSANDPTIVCLDPLSTTTCNPDDSAFFGGGVQEVTVGYPDPTSTVVTNGIDYDFVVQWKPDLDEPIDSSWSFEPNNRRNPFDCTDARIWLNGTIVGATEYMNGNLPYCVFDIQNGILKQAYLDDPGRTVFFLFKDVTDPGDDLIIRKNYETPLVSEEFYVPPGQTTVAVCDDPNGPQCNVELGVSFADTTTPVTLTYDTGQGLTLSGGVTYDYAVKWVASPTMDLDTTFRIVPDRNNDPFDCSGARIWINGTTYSATTTTGTPDTCIFDIVEGVLPQSIIDFPYENVYFLFNNLLGNNDVFYIETSNQILSIEEYAPERLDTVVCDDPNGPLCNPVSSIVFDQNPESIVLDMSPGVTRVGGFDYEVVIKWVPDDENEVIDYTWEVVPSSRNRFGSCDNVKLWVNGTIIDSDSLLRGTNNNNPYCVFKIQDGVLSQAILDDPLDKFYFLIEGFDDDGRTIVIDRNTDIPVVSSEDMVFYQYGVDSYQISSTNAGTTLTFDVSPLTYTSPAWPGPDPTCDDRDTTMGSITVGSCTVTPASFSNGQYVYDFDKSLYEFCSNNRVTDGNNYIYTIVIMLKAPEGQCKYFTPLDVTRTSLIEIRQNQIDESAGPQETTIDIKLSNYTLVPCAPVDFIVPQAKAAFIVEYNFTGNPITLTDTPYLDTPDDTLNVMSKTCTSFTSPASNVCVYEFVSSLCKPLLSVLSQSGDRCAFSSSDSKTLVDMSVEQIIDDVNQIVGIKSIPALATPLNLIIFGGQVCATNLGSEGVVNVTEVYQSRLSVRNRPFPNWGVTPSSLNFYDDMIFRMEVLDSVEGVLELHIKTVVFDISEPVSGTLINRYTFNRGDKEAMHRNDWTRYYDDVHFCRYENGDGSCSAYYEVGTDRINAFTDLTIMPQLFDVCQTDYNGTVADHFSFSPEKWFRGLNNPTVDISVVVYSEIVDCGNPGARRVLVSDSLNFMSINEAFKADTVTNRGRIAVKVIESDALDNGAGTSIIDWVIIGVLLVALIISLSTRVKKRVVADYDYVF